MTKEEFIKGIAMINAVCTKQIESDDTLTMYFAVLKNENAEDFMEAIVSLVSEKENIYNPFSPAEIKNKIKSKKPKLIASDVISMLKIDAIKYGSFKKPDYPLEIENALKAIGGWGKFCSTDEDKLIFLEKELAKELENPSVVSIGENIRRLS